MRAGEDEERADSPEREVVDGRLVLDVTLRLGTHGLILIGGDVLRLAMPVKRRKRLVEVAGWVAELVINHLRDDLLSGLYYE